MNALIQPTSRGLYCEVGDFYLDPTKPVPKAIISHGHSDHIRPRCKQYISTPRTRLILQERLGMAPIASYDYEQSFQIGPTTVSFHPAGHIVGSSQILVEYQGQRVVYSGDYKRYDDGITTAFQPVKCHQFITESTFGDPKYIWPVPAQELQRLLSWIQVQQQQYQVILALHWLGKAQWITSFLAENGLSIFGNNRIVRMNSILRKQLTTSIPAIKSAKKPAIDRSSIYITPPYTLKKWLKNPNVAIAYCSGWNLFAPKDTRPQDASFVLSDHADYEALVSTVQITGAEQIYLVHGQKEMFNKTLQRLGYQSTIWPG